MCQAKAYLDERLIMEDVIWIEPTQEGFLIRDLFGETRHVPGRVHGIDLRKHRIILTSVVDEPRSRASAGDEHDGH